MDLGKLKKWRITLSYRQKVVGLVLCGVIVGLGALFAYLLRMHTYIIGDDPAACVNCHIMSPWYVTWQHSSHGRDATCNDCHVPHTSLAAKYFFKGLDGMKHVGYFVTNSEHQAIMAEEASAEVIMDNCIRCHTEINTRMVRTGKIDYMLAKRGEGFACWDCHRNVPHGGMNTLSCTRMAAEGIGSLTHEKLKTYRYVTTIEKMARMAALPRSHGHRFRSWASLLVALGAPRRSRICF